jgi:hypothetical protein
VFSEGTSNSFRLWLMLSAVPLTPNISQRLGRVNLGFASHCIFRNVTQAVGEGLLYLLATWTWTCISSCVCLFPVSAWLGQQDSFENSASVKPYFVSFDTACFIERIQQCNLWVSISPNLYTCVILFWIVSNSLATPLASLLNSNIYWDVTPCNPVENHWRFGGSAC